MLRTLFATLLGTVFAFLVGMEILLLFWISPGLAMFPSLLWSRNPWMAALTAAVALAIAVRLWPFRTGRTTTVSPDLPAVHPGISLSHIPLSGVPGTLYLLQFVIWVVVTPAVGLFYAALIAGGALLAPVLHRLNRPGRTTPTAVPLGAVLGMLGALAVMASAASREFSPALLLTAALSAGILAAPLLVWMRSPLPPLSIAPYPTPGRQQAG